MALEQFIPRLGLTATALGEKFDFRQVVHRRKLTQIPIRAGSVGVKRAVFNIRLNTQRKAGFVVEIARFMCRSIGT
jgi:hypothetical protein